MAVLYPPVLPMLARLARELPEKKGLVYEPKWDGFRCLAFYSDGNVDLRSRNQRPLARYFPELVEAFASLSSDGVVIDGEIVVSAPEGLDFSALLQRLHPAASRVDLLRRRTPACFIAFDLLALGDHDLRAESFAARRKRLEDLMRGEHKHLLLTPMSDDPEVARAWLERSAGSGIDGVMVKGMGSTYQPGRRAMIKVKRERSADCVVAGFRWHNDEPVVGSLLLGIYSDDGHLDHVGLCASFTRERRVELCDEIAPFVTRLEGHPWEKGFGDVPGPVGRLPGAASRWSENGILTWIPLRPHLVCEVAYDHFDGKKFRHAPRFRRWRPDRDAASCTLDQFEPAAPANLQEMLAPPA